MGSAFGDQADVLSFVMAAGFFVAMLCAAILLARSASPARGQADRPS